MLGVAAKLERRRIVERTARGRADAKAAGVKFGRKPSLTPHQQREACSESSRARHSAASLGVSTCRRQRFRGWLYDIEIQSHNLKNMTKKQSVTEVYIPLVTLRTLSRDERNLLLTFAHAANDLGAIQRLVMLAQNQPSIASIYDLYTQTQAFTLHKVLAGKLYECWNLIVARYFSTRLGQTYDTKLSQSGQESLSYLKRYFGRNTNIIALIRNDAAFHYSNVDVSGYLDDLTDEDCRVYLSNTISHALYWVGEQAMRRHLLQQFDVDNNQAIKIMSEDLSNVGKYMSKFLMCVLLTLMTEATQRHEQKGYLRECKMVEGAYDPSTVKLPIFLDASSDDASELGELIKRVNSGR